MNDPSTMSAERNTLNSILRDLTRRVKLARTRGLDPNISLAGLKFSIKEVHDAATAAKVEVDRIERLQTTNRLALEEEARR